MDLKCHTSKYKMRVQRNRHSSNSEKLKERLVVYLKCIRQMISVIRKPKGYIIEGKNQLRLLKQLVIKTARTKYLI